MAFDYDLIAIGGGSGGIGTLNRAGSYGAKCLVIERDPVLGGTCVNRGCVPKKAMWYGASMAHALHDAKGYGFDVTVSGFDWTAFVENAKHTFPTSTTPTQSILAKITWNLPTVMRVLMVRIRLLSMARKK